MQLQPARTFRPVPPRKEAIPYTSEAMRQDLDRLRGAWDDCQASRDRNAIYAYLTAVYALVAWWVLAAMTNNTFFGDGQAKGGLEEMPSVAVGTQSRACIP
jgi:hypothetical protein